jgi:hypothetical protein
MSLYDGTHLYRDNTPLENGTPPAVGDESRSVFWVNALEGGVLTPPDPASGIPDVQPDPTGGWAVDVGNRQLRGMIYDIQIENINPATGDITFKTAGRYTNAGGPGTTGTWLDTCIGQVQATTAGGYGGLVVVYEVDPDDQPPMQLDPDGPAVHDGPSQWAVGGGATVDPAFPLGITDAFPTVSVVEPWLVAVLTPMPQSFLLEEVSWAGVPWTNQTVSFLAGGDTGRGFANVIGGTYAHLVGKDVFGPGMDIRIEYELNDADPATWGGWEKWSDDPIKMAFIPEPGSLALLGIALAGMGARLLRRKK